MSNFRNTPLVLVILDGFGDNASDEYNAIAHAHTPQWDEWCKTMPYISLDASGCEVGLPAEQMGNSEVGHMHIGAGRIINQDLTRINQTIQSGELDKNPILGSLFDTLEKKSKSLHIMGLLSPGGVHSHEDHLFAFLKICQQRQVNRIFLHLFMDGRDTPPQSAMNSIQKLNQAIAEYDQAWLTSDNRLLSKLAAVSEVRGDGERRTAVYTPVHEDSSTASTKQFATAVEFQKKSRIRIATLSGRYYAMDRDNRWERIEPVYTLLTQAISTHHFNSAEEAIQAYYAQNITDEFIPPTRIGEPAPIADGDAIFFFNFRADRARQLTQAFLDLTFHAFQRKQKPTLSCFVSMCEYAANLPTQILFPQIKPHNTLGEVIANAGLRQLRIAETEKYAHVTFFFNGGRENVFKGEDRVLIPSARIATYDLQPEMSAPAITEKLVDAIQQNKYDVIICNYANADMVGHTGNFNAAVAAITCLDECLHKLSKAVLAKGGCLLITADHGNAEKMFDETTHQPHTAHTISKVPCLFVGKNWHFMKQTGSLIDIAPTILALLGIAKPLEMTGNALLEQE